MKKVLRYFVFGAAVTLALSNLAACGGGKKPTELGTPPVAESLTYEERKEAAFDDLKDSAELFASQFAAAVNRTTTGENFAVSPVSVYMALALGAECAAGDTREELLSALNVTYPALKTQFSDFYRSLIAEYTSYEGQVIGRLELSNSIWVNESAQTKEACIQSLAEKYFSYSYSADFWNKNEAANQAIRNFVKAKTHGLIDQNFGLKRETLFALINTLYLKDVWNGSGKDLPFTEAQYDFTERDGTIQTLNLLQGGYITGRAVETETFRHFYTSTYNGYRIKFILPKDGFTIDEVFTEANLAAVNALTNYSGIDEKNKIEYRTRCLFPEFAAEYDEDVIPILKTEFGVKKLFSDACDFSTLTDESVFCESVQHVTKLTVDKTGVEGAAVTILVDTATSVPPYEYVFEDFVVDRAFGFILTDRYGVTLFSGVVNTI